MVFSKFIFTSLLVLLLPCFSAAAQSYPISEQCIQPSENYRGGDVDVDRLVNGRLSLYGSGGEIMAETDGSAEDDPKSSVDFGLHVCTYFVNSCATSTIDDSPAQAAKGQAKAQTAQAPAYQAPDKNKPKEVELDNVIFNETGGLRADPKAKPGAPGSAENLHAARVAVAEVAKRVLESSHPEREQAPRTLTRETQRDLNAGNKDVIRSLNDALSAARSGSNTTSGAMHFRTGRHKFGSLYGGKATMHFGPFHDATGGRHYFLTIAP